MNSEDYAILNLENSLSLIQPGKTISINRDLVNNQAKCSRKN